MAFDKSTTTARGAQPPVLGLDELRAVLDIIDASQLLAVIWKERWNGRHGYDPAALWRAHVARFLLSLPSVNDLIRRLEEDETLRLVCGFGSLPHRTTFNRFFARLSEHQDLVDQALASLTEQLRNALPGFGEKIAIDSTTVRTHSNPRRKVVSDPEASWTGKKRSDGKTEWHFGYKEHAMVDAVYGLPIVRFMTTGSRNDSPELPVLLEKAAETYEWFAPTHVMADRGYDGQPNHRAVLAQGAIPIIGIRSTPGRKRREGIYDDDGVPSCIGKVRMEYVRSDPEKGHLYRCSAEGCHLKDRQGVRYCQDEVWENRKDNPRLFGLIRRGSQEWQDLYALRQSVERVFKSLKQSRSLGEHCVRGLKRVSLHASLSMLAFQATALYRLQSGQAEWLRWQVRRVA